MEIDKTSSEWLYFRRHSSWLRKGSHIKNLLRNKIITEDNAYPGFSEKLRMLALTILSKKEDIHNLGVALSILSVVGTEDEIPLIESILELKNEELSKDVKTCVYEIRNSNSSFH